MIDAEKIVFLETWAARNKCYLQQKGEVGFGRPCVGICYGSTYVDLPLYPMSADRESSEMKDYLRQWAALPPGPEDAYHKHDCLAVLVHGEEDDTAAYDKAMEQLHDWITVLNKDGWVVRVQDRETYNKDGVGRALELMMGSASQAVLELPT